MTATFLDVALDCHNACEYLPNSPARSLVPLWTGANQKHRDFVYSELGRPEPYENPLAWQMIRTERWKYYFSPDDCSEQLYDLQNDPDECSNLADESKFVEIKNDLKSKLLAHIAKTPPAVRD